MIKLSKLLLATILVAVLISVAPLIVHNLMAFGNAITDNDWIGFFGSYSGAIIGAMIAVLVSRIQTKSAREDLEKQIQEQKKQLETQIDYERIKQKIENRVFIDYTLDIMPLLLSDKKEDKNFILLHHHIHLFIKHNPNSYLKDVNALFLTLNYLGSASCILEFQITIHLRENKGEDYVETMNRSGVNRDDGVYIPLHLEGERASLFKVEIEYTTLMQEKMKFISDMIDRKETYYVLENEKYHSIYERDLKNEFYIKPGNKLSKN